MYSLALLPRRSPWGKAWLLWVDGNAGEHPVPRLLEVSCGMLCVHYRLGAVWSRGATFQTATHCFSNTELVRACEQHTRRLWDCMVTKGWILSFMALEPGLRIPHMQRKERKGCYTGATVLKVSHRSPASLELSRSTNSQAPSFIESESTETEPRNPGFNKPSRCALKSENH